jgi:hypothetical protein
MSEKIDAPPDIASVICSLRPGSLLRQLAKRACKQVLGWQRRVRRNGIFGLKTEETVQDRGHARRAALAAYGGLRPQCSALPFHSSWGSRLFWLCLSACSRVRADELASLSFVANSSLLVRPPSTESAGIRSSQCVPPTMFTRIQLSKTIGSIPFYLSDGFSVSASGLWPSFPHVGHSANVRRTARINLSFRCFRRDGRGL